jgi:hypothetical protein
MVMFAGETTGDATITTDGEDALTTVTATGVPASAATVVMGTVHVSVVGTDGVLITVRIRQTNVSGDIIGEAVTRTVVATEAHDMHIIVVDPSTSAANLVYVITVQVASGSANTTVAYSSIVVLETGQT